MENALSELNKPVTAPLSEIIAHFITGLIIAALFLAPYINPQNFTLIKVIIILTLFWSIFGLTIFLRSNIEKSFIKDLVKGLLVLTIFGTLIGLQLTAHEYFLFPFGILLALVIVYQYVKRYI